MQLVQASRLFRQHKLKCLLLILKQFITPPDQFINRPLGIAPLMWIFRPKKRLLFCIERLLLLLILLKQLLPDRKDLFKRLLLQSIVLQMRATVYLDEFARLVEILTSAI